MRHWSIRRNWTSRSQRRIQCEFSGSVLSTNINLHSLDQHLLPRFGLTRRDTLPLPTAMLSVLPTIQRPKKLAASPNRTTHSHIFHHRPSMPYPLDHNLHLAKIETQDNPYLSLRSDLWSRLIQDNLRSAQRLIMTGHLLDLKVNCLANRMLQSNSNPPLSRTTDPLLHQHLIEPLIYQARPMTPSKYKRRKSKPTSQDHFLVGLVHCRKT